MTSPCFRAPSRHDFTSAGGLRRLREECGMCLCARLVPPGPCDWHAEERHRGWTRDRRGTADRALGSVEHRREGIAEWNGGITRMREKRAQLHVMGCSGDKRASARDGLTMLRPRNDPVIADEDGRARRAVSGKAQPMRGSLVRTITVSAMSARMTTRRPIAPLRESA